LLVASEAMGAVYWRLLGKLKVVQYNVFEENRLKINRMVKLGIGLKTWLMLRRKTYTPVYG